MLNAYAGLSQDSWRVTLHKKLLVTGNSSMENIVPKTIRSADWKKSGYLEVKYKESQTSSFLHRIRFTDELENELFAKDSILSVKISTSSLRKLFAGKKQVRIYMVLSPPNPMMAMPSRMVHLATLKLP
jgi:hypothetical protein